jgi:hypothetical protein
MVYKFLKPLCHTQDSNLLIKVKIKLFATKKRYSKW